MTARGNVSWEKYVQGREGKLILVLNTGKRSGKQTLRFKTLNKDKGLVAADARKVGAVRRRERDSVADSEILSLAAQIHSLESQINANMNKSGCSMTMAQIMNG